MSTLQTTTRDLSSLGLGALMSGYVLTFVLLCTQYVR